MANEKHIFIGLGGSGCTTVSQIKEKVYEKRFPKATATKTRRDAMNDSYRFIFLDTDQRDIDLANKRNRGTFEQGKVAFISPQTDLVNLGRANPQAIYYEATQDKSVLINKRILEACSQEVASKIPDQPLAFGAGAFRMKSRIAFAHSLADFQTKLQSAISSLNDVKTVGGEDCIIYYWVVASTLGGTGSGIFNDVLYHINQIHHQVVGNGDPQLVLTMYMPKVYIDSNATEEKYALNAFGVFSELEAFKKMSYEPNQCTVMHRLAFKNDYNLINENKRYCPFYYLIPIDIQTDKGTSLGDTGTMYRNTAEMLYHLHNGQAGATFRSDIDNYINDIMERDHRNFLVPMGYVSLQKPDEQFRNYMNARFNRDVLNSWLLNEGPKSKPEKSEIEELENVFFGELKVQPGSIAESLTDTPDGIIEELKNNLHKNSKDKTELPVNLKFSSVNSTVSTIVDNIKAQITSSDIRGKNKELLNSSLWSKTEDMIRERGLIFTINALDEVRKNIKKNFDEETQKIVDKQGEIETQQAKLQKMSKDAEEYTAVEHITGGQAKQVESYKQVIPGYVDLCIECAIMDWAHDLKKDFTDEKTGLIAKLLVKLNAIREKAKEMAAESVKSYNSLSTKFGQAALDVTTVYLPQLKNVCNGDGWIPNNIFSSLYKKIVEAEQDANETPHRSSLVSLIDQLIYKASESSKVFKDIEAAQYRVIPVKKEDKDAETPDKTPETRFFTVPETNKLPEKIIEEFLGFCNTAFVKFVGESEVNSLWYEKKISTFFNDLTNDEKDEVRRSLSPSLFFSYNTSKIEVTKKEEHVVFVAGSRDLATEMLGYQNGNPKHRFVQATDESMAIVLKSKFGLALEDYRIYDSIKMVYDKATFREKYHFHHDFAQYKDKLTIDDLPLEVLPQHYSYAKMLLLNKFTDEFSKNNFFYKDKYEKNAYTETMLIENPNNETIIKIARPEALSISKDDKAQVILKLKDNGRDLYEEISGEDFPARFQIYQELYYNLRFGETVNNLLQDLLRQTVMDTDGNTKSGKDIIVDNYTQKREELLQSLSDAKDHVNKPSVQRLYSVLFNIVREEFDTVNNFIKSK